MALGILAASFQGSLDAPPAALVVCSVTYAFAFGVVFVMWSARLRELVFEHGLTNVVALSLVAIALSFVAVPSRCASAGTARWSSSSRPQRPRRRSS